MFCLCRPGNAIKLNLNNSNKKWHLFQTILRSLAPRSHLFRDSTFWFWFWHFCGYSEEETCLHLGISECERKVNGKIVKKAIKKNKTKRLHVQRTFFGTFRRRNCTTTTWKCLISRFMEEVNKRRRNFLSLS